MCVLITAQWPIDGIKSAKLPTAFVPCVVEPDGKQLFVREPCQHVLTCMSPLQHCKHDPG